MIEGMKCLKCNQRAATVKIIRIIGGKAHSVFLCEQCAADVSPYQQSLACFQEAIEKVLNQLVQQHAEEEQSKEEDAATGPRCPVCGTTLAIYRKSFRLGCTHCYDTFQEILEAQLRRYHGSTRHVGRAPAGIALPPRDEQGTVAALLKDLAAAISNEDFEKAVELRDRIRSLPGGSDHVSPKVPEV